VRGSFGPVKPEIHFLASTDQEAHSHWLMMIVLLHNGAESFIPGRLLCKGRKPLKIKLMLTRGEDFGLFIRLGKRSGCRHFTLKPNYYSLPADHLSLLHFLNEYHESNNYSLAERSLPERRGTRFQMP
jgi:hypothetical protein